MDSAGKRDTRPPDYLITTLLESSKPKKKMGPVTTSATTATTNTTTVTSSSILQPTSVTIKTTATTPSSSGSSSRSEDPFVNLQKMIKNMQAKNEALHVESIAHSEKLMGTLDAKSNARHAETQERFNECLQRWQVLDTRVCQVEDTMVRHNAHITDQVTTNSQVSDRLNHIENEVISIRHTLSRLSTLGLVPSQMENPSVPLSTSFLSSTAQPNTNVNVGPTSVPVPGLPSTSVNPIQNDYTTFDQSRVSFYGSPERLQDAVSEFSGQIQTLHPERFLHQLNAYFESIPMTSTQQLICAQRRLSGDARMWYESLIPTPDTYVEFCMLFRQRFWSDAAQRKARNDVLRPYLHDRYTGLATHAMKWIASAKYLSPPFHQSDLVSIIIQHFPTPISIALRGRRPRTTNELLSILTEFEESASPGDNPRDDNRRYENRRPSNQSRLSTAQPSQPNNRNNEPYHRRNNSGNHGYQSCPVPTENSTVQPVNQIDISGNGPAPRP